MIAEKAAKGGGGKKPFRKAARQKPQEAGSEEAAGQEEGLDRGTQDPAGRSKRRRRRRRRPRKPTSARRARKSCSFIAENPDRSGKREIAKAFSLKGDDRIWLKDLLRDLQDEGLLEKDRKRLIRPGALPHVVVLDIFGRDAEGGLLARPSEHAATSRRRWSSIRAPRGGGGPAPGIGDRVLAKVFPTDEATGPAYTGARHEGVREAQRGRARRLRASLRTARSASSRSSAASRS